MLPNVTYLAKVRNTDELIETEQHEEADHSAAAEHDASNGEHKADSTLPSAVKPEEAHRNKKSDPPKFGRFGFHWATDIFGYLMVIFSAFNQCSSYL